MAKIVNFHQCMECGNAHHDCQCTELVGEKVYLTVFHGDNEEIASEVTDKTSFSYHGMYVQSKARDQQHVLRFGKIRISREEFSRFFVQFVQENMMEKLYEFAQK